MAPDPSCMSNNDKIIKCPRLYVDSDLQANAEIFLPAAQAHYLRNVLRRQTGQTVRLFNGRNGEWAVTLETVEKKAVCGRAIEQIRTQPPAPRGVHLFFTPIKKQRMDRLIEESVELGVTALHPILTKNTDAHRLNEERIRAQIVEASEQCERLDIPSLMPLTPFNQAINNWAQKNNGAPLFACLERTDTPLIAAALETHHDTQQARAFLIGPAGGFTNDEKETLSSHPAVQAVSLGEAILRCETAVAYALCANKITS